MDIKQLTERYRTFYAPSFEVRLGGMSLAQLGVAISDVEVDSSVNEAAYFRFTVRNAYDPTRKELRWIEDVFVFGRKIQISLGYVDQMQQIFSGIVTSVYTFFPEQGAPEIEVSGFDLSYPMVKGKKARAWEKVKHSDIVKQIAAEYQMKAEVEDTGVVFPKISKAGGESDFAFVRRLAEQNYFDVFVAGETLFFRKPLNEARPLLELEWGKHLICFSPEMNLARQVSKVFIRGWDIRQKKPIVGTAQKGDESGRDREAGRQSGAELVQIFGRETAEEHWDYPVSSQQEADRLATAILNRRSEGLVRGIGETVGIPDIRPGQMVQLTGLGRKFSKAYYIERCVHRLDQDGYRTSFHVKESTI